MPVWVVRTKPQPENPSPEGKNESGIVVELTDGKQHVEVSRVLFVRRNAMNKSVGFKRQLLKEMDKAFEAAEVLNDTYLSSAEEDSQKAAAIEDAEEKRRVFLEKLQENPAPRA